MTDRELLELAAKAAGIDVSSASWRAKRDCQMWGMAFKQGDIWNPLTDDGDALRLAVILRLEIRMSDELQDTMVHQQFRKSCAEKWRGDPYAATRRAIVRAAAEIGRAE